MRLMRVLRDREELRARRARANSIRPSNQPTIFRREYPATRSAGRVRATLDLRADRRQLLSISSGEVRTEVRTVHPVRRLDPRGCFGR